MRTHPADGAAVACGSTLQNKVVDAALRYIIHRVFGGPDRSGGHSFSRDAFFVPAGWDTPAKVALLSEGAVAADGRRLGTGYPEGTPFNDVILPPAVDQVRPFACRLGETVLVESSQEQAEGLLLCATHRATGPTASWQPWTTRPSWRAYRGQQGCALASVQVTAAVVTLVLTCAAIAQSVRAVR